MTMKIPHAYLRNSAIVLMTFFATVTFAAGYLQSCEATTDTGNCSAGSSGSCVITTNPNGKCGLGGYCQAGNGAGSVPTTTQVGTCTTSGGGGIGMVCAVGTPPVAGPPGTAVPNCF